MENKTEKTPINYDALLGGKKESNNSGKNNNEVDDLPY